MDKKKLVKEIMKAKGVDVNNPIIGILGPALLLSAVFGRQEIHAKICEVDDEVHNQLEESAVDAITNAFTDKELEEYHDLATNPRLVELNKKFRAAMDSAEQKGEKIVRAGMEKVDDFVSTVGNTSNQKPN